LRCIVVFPALLSLAALTAWGVPLAFSISGIAALALYTIHGLNKEQQ